jgi:hypothetical protein
MWATKKVGELARGDRFILGLSVVEVVEVETGWRSQHAPAVKVTYRRDSDLFGVADVTLPADHTVSVSEAR